MCGISGVIAKSGKSVDADLLKQVNNLAMHRGPDGEGYFFSDNVGLGHRRLSIIDLSDGGHQPQTLESRYTVTFNGEIYNYIELREELEGMGYSFTSSSDTEVLLVAYQCWGEKCVERFNGQWAFAIYDSENKTLFLSRDRFGKKPLYYISTDEYFAFASEIKQLLPLLENRKVNFDLVSLFLLHAQIEQTDGTFFEAIEKCPAAHYLLLDCKSMAMTSHQYFDIVHSPEVAHKDFENSCSGFLKLLQRSVLYRLRSDVKVGTCLSGGLDSSSVAAMAMQSWKESTDQKFMAITAKSVEPKGDETHYAKQVSDHLDLDWHVITPQLDEFKNMVDEVVYTQEEPFEGPSIFMQYFVMQKANKLGCKVMLDGQGGDETLLGYENYVPELLRNQLTKFQWYQAKDTLSIVSNIKMSTGQIFAVVLANMFEPFKRALRLHARNKRIKDPARRLKLSQLTKKSGWSSLFLMQRNEIQKAQLPVLLRYEDKNSMRHSVETRLPFLDYELVKYVCSVKPQYKITKGYSKYLLRKAIEPYLPESIVWRTDKLGFEAPVDTWVDGYRETMLDAIERSKILSELSSDYNTMNNRQLWKYFSVARWESVYEVTL